MKMEEAMLLMNLKPPEREAVKREEQKKKIQATETSGKGSYVNHSSDTKERFFYLVYEKDLTPGKAATQLNIARHTAYNWFGKDQKEQSDGKEKIKAKTACSKKGTRAEVVQPTTRAKTTTILGAISPFGVVNIQVRRPVAPSKKRKANNSKAKKTVVSTFVSTLSYPITLYYQNITRYKRDVTKYHHDEWTIAEEINKSFIPKLKHYTVDTTQVVNAHYKGAEISRLHGREATEIFEQLSIIKAGEISTAEAHQLLDEAIESARRLATHAWFQDSSSKREAFDDEFIAMYNEANYQQRVLRAATINPSNGRGRGGYSNSSSWNSNRGGGRGYFGRGGPKNYFGGRGRGSPTFYNSTTSADHTTTRPPSQQ
ncbi:uncharacterized protein B0P05DRAFT_586344 [Gilbertella persicaria]|uniref:uncharacterized protein n=1 Tax=Gilbertella persicaria TaxID=101096 RepID=UPI00221FC77E|nr:uncharacterized protein B0P05DRAFT_586344 [Gilbertella persicaria]KAI8081800.1 hypothetical protein B0P05DRAFT_586344 [Gilbertella persicaria]